MNSVQSRLLAATGAVALCFVPISAHAATSAPAAVHAEDEAESTSAPEGAEKNETADEVEESTEEAPAETEPTPEGEATSDDEATSTEDVAEQTAEPRTAEDEPEVGQEAEDGEVSDEDEFGEEGIPADDPDFWAQYLSGEGFEGVQCFTEFGSGPTYELTEAAEPGTDWLLIVLASNDDGGIFDIISEPQVGEVFSLEGDDGAEATLAAVVVCQANLNMSDVDPDVVLDDLDGEGNAITEEEVFAAGPKVETDVPAGGSNGGLGAIVGLSALLMGAGGVVASRRLASRR